MNDNNNDNDLLSDLPENNEDNNSENSENSENNENNENNEEIIDISDLERYSQESLAFFNVTQEHLHNILKAIASGEKIVRFGDRYVEYRSIDELLKAKSLIETELAKNKKRCRTTRIYSKGKGWRKK